MAQTSDTSERPAVGPEPVHPAPPELEVEVVCAAADDPDVRARVVQALADVLSGRVG